MGAIEDIRKVLQDFLAPELHAIKEQLKTLENGLRDFRAEVRVMFDKSEQRNETRHQELIRNLNLEARVQRIEGYVSEKIAPRADPKPQPDPERE